MKQSIGEFDLIARLTEGVQVEDVDLGYGVGDDCAIISGPDDRDWLVTTDALVEGVHFKREWSGFYHLGRKAITVNLSDVAAMGGRPRFYLVTIGMPKGFSPENISELYRGIRDASEGALLIGGDTVVNPDGILISITMIGDLSSGNSIMRSGASSGDGVFVSGSLGGSALGLECLQSDATRDWYAPFVERHLKPTARLADGAILSASGMVGAMIDISDGLLADLGHIADMSDKGFEISASSLPLFKGVDSYAPELGMDGRTLALTGGEEYELLFTVAAERLKNFERDVMPELITPVTRIGFVSDDSSFRRVVDEAGQELSIDVGGFDHFL